MNINHSICQTAAAVRNLILLGGLSSQESSFLSINGPASSIYELVPSVTLLNSASFISFAGIQSLISGVTYPNSLAWLK
jgi:hypothetical protein